MGTITFKRWRKNGLDRFYVNGIEGQRFGRTWLEADRDGCVAIRHSHEAITAHRSVLHMWELDIIEALAERGITRALCCLPFADLVAAYEAATAEREVAA